MNGDDPHVQWNSATYRAGERMRWLRDRLVIVSLSSDDYPFEPKRYADRHDLRWLQGFIGPASPVAAAYGVTGIPSIWLIAGGVTVMATPGTFIEFSRQRVLAPDGHIVQNHLRAEQLRTAVEAALAK